MFQHDIGFRCSKGHNAVYKIQIVVHVTTCDPQHHGKFSGKKACKCHPVIICDDFPYFVDFPNIARKQQISIYRSADSLKRDLGGITFNNIRCLAESLLSIDSVIETGLNPIPARRFHGRTPARLFWHNNRRYNTLSHEA